MEIEELRQIPLKEIAKKTQLDEHNIKAILDKDFEKLANVNVYMNIKILQREFNVDFTDLKHEYENHKVHTDSHKLKIQPVLLHYNSSKSRASSSFIGYFILVLFLCAVVYAIYYFIENQNQNYELTQETISISNVNANNENKEESLIENKEEKSTLTEESIKKNNENLNHQEEKQNIQNINEDTTQLQENLTQAKANKEIIKEENVVNTEKIIENKEQEVKANKQDNILVIIPHQKIWMSIKDLNEKISKHYLLEKKIELNANSLIFLGKNNYDLYLNKNKITAPIDKDGRYLIFQDNKVEFLTRVEFNKIDKMSK